MLYLIKIHHPHIIIILKTLKVQNVLFIFLKNILLTLVPAEVCIFISYIIQYMYHIYIFSHQGILFLRQQHCPEVQKGSKK